MKKLLLILSILISSVVYAGGGEGEYISLKEKFMMEYSERSKTPYLYSEDLGNDTIDYLNFNKDLVEYLILKKINDHRLNNGVSILVEDTSMKNLARGWSEVMDSTEVFQHNPELPAMECITMDNSSANPKTYNEMAESTFQIWKNSKGHNAVMIGNDNYYGSIGVTYSYKECDRYTESGTNLCEMFNLKGSYKMYITFNTVTFL